MELRIIVVIVVLMVDITVPTVLTVVILGRNVSNRLRSYSVNGVVFAVAVPEGSTLESFN